MTGEVYIGSDSERCLSFLGSEVNPVNSVALILIPSLLHAFIIVMRSFACYLNYAQDGYLDTVT